LPSLEIGIDKMEIEYGALVKDKNGKALGTVNRVMRDTWTGDVSKFSVSTELADADLFYAVEDVAEADDKEVKLNITYGESDNEAVQFGARVIDPDGRELGTIDYLVSDSLTGEITKFRIKTGTAEESIFFSMDDVAEATPSEVKLKTSLKK
jgi:sporulation protein YlmC with PRC-barrel domain